MAGIGSFDGGYVFFIDCSVLSIFDADSLFYPSLLLDLFAIGFSTIFSLLNVVA